MRLAVSILSLFWLLWAPNALAGAGKLLRIGLITPPVHNWSKTAKDFGEELRQLSNGRITVAIFPSGQLGNEAQMLQLLQIGALDIGFFTTSELANRLPSFAAFYTPYLADDAAHAARLLEGPAAKEILRDAARLGVVGLGYGMAGMRQLVSRVEIASPADLRGLKVRVVPDAPLTDFWAMAGAAPTPIPLSSLYDAFANGQVDAMHIDFENTLKQKFYSHASVVIHSDHMVFPMAALGSARSFASLSADERSLIVATLDKHLAALRKTYVAADLSFLKGLEEVDVKVKKADKLLLQKGSRAWLEKWRQQTPAIDALRKDAARTKYPESAKW